MNKKSHRFFKGKLLPKGRRNRPQFLFHKIQSDGKREAPSYWPSSSRATPNSWLSWQCTNRQATQGYSGHGCALVLLSKQDQHKREKGVKGEIEEVCGIIV